MPGGLVLRGFLPLLLWPWAWRITDLRAWVVLRSGVDGGARLLAIWGVSTVVLFSLISGKQVHYLIPAFLAAAWRWPQRPRPGGCLGAGPGLPGGGNPGSCLGWSTVRGRRKSMGWTCLPWVRCHWPLPQSLPSSALRRSFPSDAAHGAGVGDGGAGGPYGRPCRPASCLFEHFDSARFAAELGRDPARASPLLGYPYQGEFGFTARLSAPSTCWKTAGLMFGSRPIPAGLSCRPAMCHLPPHCW